MKIENKRIFIKDLPETATPDEIQLAFSKFGKVANIEIKERKQLTALNKSLFFAYINLETDDNTLQKCFKYFLNNKWLGDYVELQLAKESFLERLRRERQENPVKKEENRTELPEVKLNNGLSPEKKITAKRKLEKEESSDSSSSSDEEEHLKPKKALRESSKIETKNTVQVNGVKDESEELNLVIKDNKGKTVNKNGLKIETVGNTPIIKIEQKKKSKKVLSENEQKRLGGLKKIISQYNQKQALIKNALASVDAKRNNKIVFDDEETEKNEKIISNESEGTKSKNLFEDGDEEEAEYNFEVKTQFEGKKGQKLLELQSKFKNDKRFAMDEKFLDDEEVENEETDNKNSNELSLEEEKSKQFEILEQVLGRKLKPIKTNDFKTEQKKKMLRFDPSQPDHLKFEVKPNVIETPEMNRKKKQKEKQEEQKTDVETPIVSQEVFYEVKENVLKEALETKQGFSLLNQFGRTDVEDHEEEENEETKPKEITKNLLIDKTPFKYDSSEDEEEELHKKEESNENNETDRALRARNFWNEPFFFKDDDYRMQEGLDFVKRIQSSESEDFQKVRRQLKEIVRSKVRNNLRNNRPFMKKLGGNKRRKIKRIKKALSR